MKFFLKYSVLSLLATSLLAACQTTKMAENAVELGLDFSWENTKTCTKISPAFKVTNIPGDTKKLSFHMTDLQAPGYPHGGSTIVYTGNGNIPEGAISYVGPCPPMTHTYKWTVLALNEDESLILGKGVISKPFTP